MDRQSGPKFEDEENLVARCARIERGTDMAARA
jgi:hypothetical protein